MIRYDTILYTVLYYTILYTILYTIYYILYTTDHLLYIIYYILYTMYDILYTIYDTLYTIHYSCTYLLLSIYLFIYWLSIPLRLLLCVLLYLSVISMRGSGGRQPPKKIRCKCRVQVLK